MSIQIILILLLVNFFSSFIFYAIFPDELKNTINHIIQPREITYLTLIILILFLPTVILVFIIVSIQYHLGTTFNYVISKLGSLLNQKIFK